MFLQKLTIQGFKSFANKTELLFPEPKIGSSITAIVGPNGSGKSNCAEAVRWVLGEQSLKLLRSKKSEDVIFSGSDRRGKSSMAEVSIYLNNQDGQAPIDYSEVIITRRLYRDGASEYLINNSKTRLSDINLLLAQAGLGVRTYNVVGQGMIESLLIMSPEERKEFLGEAAGIKEFEIKKHQAESKLDSTHENLRQVDILLNELEPRLRSLRRQVRKLEERSTLEEQLHAMEHQYYGSLWRNLGTELKTQTATLADKEKIIAQKYTVLNALSQKLNELEKKETPSEIVSKLQAEYQNTIKQKTGLMEKEFDLKRKIDILSYRQPTDLPLENLKKYFYEIHSLHEKLFQTALNAKTIEEIKHLVAEIRDKSTAVVKELQGGKVEAPKEILEEAKAVSVQIENLNARLTSLADKIAEVQTEAGKTKGEFFTLQRELQGKQREAMVFESEANLLRVEKAKLETRLESLEQEMTVELKERVKKIKSEAAAMEVHPQPEALLPEIQKLRYSLEMVGGIDTETVREYEETSKRFEFLESQSVDLKGAIQSLRDMIMELDRTIEIRFNESFKKINAYFDKYFKILFNGGEAKLLRRLIEEEPEEETETAAETKKEKVETPASTEKKYEIEIVASPPGKKIKNLTMLSGGEKALTSVALLCAILANNPSPFVVLDEVDAALDEANALRYASILEELAHQTQFIVITHNRYTMEKSAFLYGVTMKDDSTSQLLSIKLEDVANA